MYKNLPHLRMLLLLPLLAVIFAKVQAGPVTSSDNTELLNKILQVVQEQGEQIKLLGETFDVEKTSLLEISTKVEDLKTEENYLLSVLTGQQTLLTKKMEQVEQKMSQNQEQLRQNQDQNQKNIMNKFVEDKKLACDIHYGGLNLITLNDKKYFFSHNMPVMSWYDAQTFCRSHNMDLVSVETHDEWVALHPEVGKLYASWSSARDSVQEGKWIWGNGHDVTYHAGDVKHNDDNNDCMFLRTGYWGAWPCSQKTTYICEVNSDC